MDSHQVRQLEEQVAWAITEVLKSHFPGHRESPRITHLMAKVASSRNRDGWVRGVRDDAPFRSSTLRLRGTLSSWPYSWQRSPRLPFRISSRCSRRRPCIPDVGPRLMRWARFASKSRLKGSTGSPTRRRLRGRPIHGFLRPARAAGPEAEDPIVRTVHQLLPPAFDGPRKP